MSFEAGAIEGGIHFNVEEFTGGFERIGHIAEGFPELVARLLDAPLHTAVSSVGGLAQSLSSFMGPVGTMVGGLGAIATAAIATGAELKHLANETANEAVATDRMAQKAGVGIEFFSEWSAVARLTGGV